jgi:ElaB/YqjD/DUF883 family membrane-anchored ribosome-binding protein
MMDKSQELQQLTGHVEGLMSKVANEQSPQLQELRSRVIFHGHAATIVLDAI